MEGVRFHEFGSDVGHFVTLAVAIGLKQLPSAYKHDSCHAIYKSADLIPLATEYPQGDGGKATCSRAPCGGHLPLASLPIQALSHQWFLF